MSQDIRNFFNKSPKGDTGVKKTSDPPSKSKKRQRKCVISDSDSEDEPIVKISRHENTPKGSKKAVKSPSKSPSKSRSPSKSPKKAKVELPKVSLIEMLGKTPVKRVVATKTKVRTECPRPKDEFEGDPELEAALLEIDESKEDDWFQKKPNFSSLQKKNGLKESSKIEVETKTPVKSCTTKTTSPTDDEPRKKKSKIDKVKKNSINETDKNICNTTENDSKDNGKSGTNKACVEIKEPVKEKNVYLDEIVAEDNHTGKYELKKKKEKGTPIVDKLKANSTHSKRRESPVKSTNSKNEVLKDKTNLEKLSPPIKESKEIYELWVDRYKPTSLKQIIGQQGEKSNVNKLVRWLRDWSKNQEGGKKHTKPSPWAKDDSGAYFKAALLSGPPGVGKTTTAHLVSKEVGMDVVEFNASDTRSKKLLSQEVSELLSSKSLSPFLQGGGVTKRHVLLMDEVDGMAGTEDRGGVQELMQLIKTSKVPVICMCNDRNHPKIRSLANYCFDLRFCKPRVDQIKGAMMSICFKETLKVKPETLVDIINSTNQDVRLVLNHLSMLAAKSETDLTAVSKHIKLGPWDVLRKVFSETEHKQMSIYDKSDLFFHDYSIAPLFVHENYLLVSPHSKSASTKWGKMELFAKAVSSLCNGDLVESAIRSNNAWSLLPVQAIFSSLIPGEVLEGHVSGQITFPAWFGKNSRRSKLDRLTQELQTHTRLRISGSKSAVNLDYAKALRDLVLQPLINDGSEGVQSALATLHNYNLLRDDLDSLAELNSWPGCKDPMSSIDSKVKAAFTRAYNKAPVMTPFCLPPISKKGRSAAVDELVLEEGGDGDDDEEENEDDISACSMITVKKKTEKVKKEKLAAEPNTSKKQKEGKGKKSKKK